MQLNYLENIKKMGVPLLSGLIGAALVLLGSFAFNTQPKLACVNVNKIVSEYIEQNKQSQQDDTQLAIQSSRFMDALEQTMHAYSKKNKVALVVSEAIITGAKDVTQVIRENMGERLNG